jgi:hypothetical protein
MYPPRLVQSRRRPRHPGWPSGGELALPSTAPNAAERRVDRNVRRLACAKGYSAFVEKRRGRDSNPRYALTTHNGFRDRRIQPLCHPSRCPRILDKRDRRKFAFSHLTTLATAIPRIRYRNHCARIPQCTSPDTAGRRCPNPCCRPMGVCRQGGQTPRKAVLAESLVAVVSRAEGVLTKRGPPRLPALADRH